jgi:hypothetical protein
MVLGWVVGKSGRKVDDQAVLVLPPYLLDVEQDD